MITYTVGATFMVARVVSDDSGVCGGLIPIDGRINVGFEFKTDEYKPRPYGIFKYDHIYRRGDLYGRPRCV